MARTTFGPTRAKGDGASPPTILSTEPSPSASDRTAAPDKAGKVLAPETIHVPRR